jgi:hypothetical protein
MELVFNHLRCVCCTLAFVALLFCVPNLVNGQDSEAQSLENQSGNSSTACMSEKRMFSISQFLAFEGVVPINKISTFQYASLNNCSFVVQGAKTAGERIRFALAFEKSGNVESTTAQQELKNIAVSFLEGLDLNLLEKHEDIRLRSGQYSFLSETSSLDPEELILRIDMIDTEGQPIDYFETTLYWLPEPDIQFSCESCDVTEGEQAVVRVGGRHATLLRSELTVTKASGGGQLVPNQRLETRESDMVARFTLSGEGDPPSTLTFTMSANLDPQRFPWFDQERSLLEEGKKLDSQVLTIKHEASRVSTLGFFHDNSGTSPITVIREGAQAIPVILRNENNSELSSISEIDEMNLVLVQRGSSSEDVVAMFGSIVKVDGENHFTGLLKGVSPTEWNGSAVPLLEAYLRQGDKSKLLFRTRMRVRETPLITGAKVIRSGSGVASSTTLYAGEKDVTLRLSGPGVHALTGEIIFDDGTAEYKETGIPNRREVLIKEVKRGANPQSTLTFYDSDRIGQSIEVQIDTIQKPKPLEFVQFVWPDSSRAFRSNRNTEVDLSIGRDEMGPNLSDAWLKFDYQSIDNGLPHGIQYLDFKAVLVDAFNVQIAGYEGCVAVVPPPIEGIRPYSVQSGCRSLRGLVSLEDLFGEALPRTSPRSRLSIEVAHDAGRYVGKETHQSSSSFLQQGKWAYRIVTQFPTPFLFLNEKVDEAKFSLTGIAFDARYYKAKRPIPVIFRAGLTWSGVYSGERVVDKINPMAGLVFPVRDYAANMSLNVAIGAMYKSTELVDGAIESNRLRWFIQPGISYRIAGDE